MIQLEMGLREEFAFKVSSVEFPKGTTRCGTPAAVSVVVVFLGGNLGKPSYARQL